MQRRVHVIVSGRVQGVFYRASTVRQAAGLGVTGWVRNLPDGRVELVAEGPYDQVDALLRWCGQGPPRARVDAMDVMDATPTGEFVDFEARR